MLNLGVLVSGRGSNLQSIIDACAQKKIGARVAVVVSNKPGVAALERAEKTAIPTQVVLYQKGEEREAYDKRVVPIFKEHQVDLVVLAGFMRIVSPYFISQFPGRVINIHPSLLPAFPGIESQKQALEAGVKVTGCTVHLVDPGCDTGPILLQSAVPVLPDDTVEALSARILAEEHVILPKAIDLFAKDKVKVVGQKVIINGA